METELKKTIARDGYVFIQNHESGLSTIESLSLLGRIQTLDGFSPIQILRPQTISISTPNTYSGNFGTAEFPLHTDLSHWAEPPRYIALRCISGTPEVTTRIFDGNLLISAIGYNNLRRTLVQPRRPVKNNRQLLRLLDHKLASDTQLLRWDSIFLRPSTPKSEQVHALVSEYLSGAITDEIKLLNLGDTLLIDNWRMLHGRSVSPESASNRHIERAYIGDIH